MKHYSYENKKLISVRFTLEYTAFKIKKSPKLRCKVGSRRLCFLHTAQTAMKLQLGLHWYVLMELTALLIIALKHNLVFQGFLVSVLHEVEGEGKKKRFDQIFASSHCW